MISDKPTNKIEPLLFLDINLVNRKHFEKWVDTHRLLFAKEIMKLF